MTVADCVFCSIVAGDAPATVLWQGHSSMVIKPLNPVTKGHVLAISFEHVDDFTEKHHATIVTMTAAFTWARWIGGDCNLITSKGPAATQTVTHLHVHIVPRREGDGLLLPWSNQTTLAPDDAVRHAIANAHLAGADLDAEWQGRLHDVASGTVSPEEAVAAAVDKYSQQQESDDDWLDVAFKRAHQAFTQTPPALQPVVTHAAPQKRSPLRFELVDPDDPRFRKCNAASSKSKQAMYCELPPDHPETYHMARNRVGAWRSWEAAPKLDA